MEIPTARIMKKDSYRAGAGQVYPYRYYYLAMSPFKNFEFGGRVTEVIGVEAFEGEGYGNTKDKALDVKYKFLEEGKFTPALAIGIMDPQGTRLYPSQYLVASKQIYPFDFTIGFGNGRFGKRPLSSSGETFKVEMFSDPSGWLKDSQLFWGVQFALSEKYSFMVEYSPIRYEKQTQDPAQAKYFQRAVPSKFNFGFRWKPFKWSEIDITYQRGNQIGMSLSTVFDIGKPFVPIFDPPYAEKKQDSLSPLSKRLVKALSGSGFSNIGITIEHDTLRIEAQNDKYFYSTRAISVILRLVAAMTPPGIQKFDIILTQNSIPMVEYSTIREDVADLYREKLTRSEFVFLSKIDTNIHKNSDVEIQHKKWVEYGVKPSFETLVQQKTQFFQYRLGVEGWLNYHPWEGASLVAGAGVYPLKDIKYTVEPVPNPVRSDVFLYKEKSANMNRLMAEQIFKWDRQVYGRLSGGFLEIEYAGLDAEIAVPLFDGRFLVGVSGSAVKKRDPDNPFKLKEGDDVRKIYTTAFFNARLNLPEYNMAVDVKTGRFLGRDIGSRVAVSKNIYGVVLTAWYSFTNTNVFQDSTNRGYHDKGISITIPIRIFQGSDSKTAYSYVFSPWTRDVAQDIDHFNGLFDFIGRNLKIFFDKDEKEMKFWQ
ncbi:MAG: hypothetical protein C0399_09960 [Syntrophus sp. (in: bacteria)]|nr:hypothetical protein [Syntrophus sp. (in: bacteria)]MBA4418571.1 hypothetical protein [Syntrophus sp. (in: bacteria)]